MVVGASSTDWRRSTQLHRLAGCQAHVGAPRFRIGLSERIRSSCPPGPRRRSEPGGSNMAKTSFTLVGNSADSRRLADETPCIATPNGAAGKRCPGGASVLTRWFAGAQRRQRVPLTRRPVRRARSARRTISSAAGGGTTIDDRPYQRRANRPAPRPSAAAPG
jgi:hypothetical protein